eukprot:jgi/Tetstr1/440550/TSEL_028872.t1
MKYSVIPANNGSRLLASQLTLYAVGIAGLVFLALGLSRLPALHALLARQVRRIRRRRAAAMKPANSELHSNASSALDVAIGMLLLISAVYGGAALNLATTFSSRSSYQVYDSPTSMPRAVFYAPAPRGGSVGARPVGGGACHCCTHPQWPLGHAAGQQRPAGYGVALQRC